MFSVWFLVGFIFRGVLAPIKDIHMHTNNHFKELSSYPHDRYGWNFLKSRVEKTKIVLAQVKIFCSLTFNISSESWISLLEFLMKCIGG